MKTDSGTGVIPGITGILGSVNKEIGNAVNGVFIDETLREFFSLKEHVFIPAIPVSSIGHNNALEIIRTIAQVIPGFLAGHAYMEKRNPASEEHSIHMISPVKGKIVDFVHMLRLDFKFSTHSGTIVKPGGSATFPSYNTDRIYFRSRLVPVSKGSATADPDFIRLKGSVRVEAEDSHKRLFTSVLFDDFSSREISIELSRKAGDIFKIPVPIYPMVVYDYFTSCLNVPDPTHNRIEEAAMVFEPLFIYLYSDVSGSGHALVQEGLDIWSDCLEIKSGSIVMRPAYLEKLEKYFSCYSLYADDELMLKGWKKIASC